MMMASAARPARGGDVLAEWAQSLTGQTAGRSRGRLLRQLSLQFRVLGSQLRVLLPQPGVRLLQRGYHIRRTGHSGTTSQPTLSKEIDTVSRSATRSTRTHQTDLNAYNLAWESWKISQITPDAGLRGWLTPTAWNLLHPMPISSTWAWIGATGP